MPLWFDTVLRKAMDINPEKRYLDIDEFMADLEKPNAKLMSQQGKTLIEKDPVKFWQAISVIQLIIIIGLLAFYTN